MIDNVIKELLFLLKKREGLEQAFNNFIRVASDNFCNGDVYIGFDPVEGFIRGIETLNKELAEDLSRYIYEVDQLKDEDVYTIEEDGKEYKIKTLQDFINYLKDRYD